MIYCIIFCQTGQSRANIQLKFHLFFTECKSWFGKKHVKCQNNDSVCTLDGLEFNSCRNCTFSNTSLLEPNLILDPSKWRCDDGWCIDGDLKADGIPHCKDGTDERPSKCIGNNLH